MVVDAATGGSGDGLSSVGPATWTDGSTQYAAVGARVSNVGTGGSLPVVTRLGGGSLLVPGLKLTSGSGLNINDAIWRRRSWYELGN
jgi:type IV pilus assembly protein PilY1